MIHIFSLGTAKDKRNLYLSNEGLNFKKEKNRARDKGKAKDFVPDMCEADKIKRERAQSEKKRKLQNPLFFVSAVRLSIRNMNKSVTDKELKELVVIATKKGSIIIIIS